MLTSIHASTGTDASMTTGVATFGDDGVSYVTTNVSRNDWGSHVAKHTGTAYASAWDQSSTSSYSDFGPNTGTQSTSSKPQYVTATIQPNKVVTGVQDSEDSGGMFTGVSGMFTGVTSRVRTATNARSTK